MENSENSLDKYIEKIMEDDNKKIAIDGLKIIENFVDEEEEKQLLKIIDEVDWYKDPKKINEKLKRATQHYGYIFDFRANKLIKIKNEIPKYYDYLMIRMLEMNIIENPFEQLIINEYLNGQEITAHTDSLVFGNIIVGLSMNDDCDMLFQDNTNQEKKIIKIPRRSLMIMKDNVRYNWKHSIKFNGKRRISCTFRHII